MRLAVRPVVLTLEDRSTPATFFVDPTLSAVNQTFNAGQPNSQTVVFGTTGFDTINDALTAAAASPDGFDSIILSNSGHALDNSGGTIVIDINNSVEITAGTGQGFTAPAVVTPTTSTADDLTAVIQADGDLAVLDLSNFTFDGGSPGLDIGRLVQYTDTAVGEINNMIFQNVAFATPPNNNPGIVVTLQTGATVVVLGSSFTNYGNAGVSVADSIASIQTSTFNGGGALASTIQYGVQVANTTPANSAEATINANTFNGFVGTDGGASSAGVFVFDTTGVSPDVDVFGNNFNSGELGVLVDTSTAGTDSSAVDVFANNFVGNAGPGIAASQSTGGSVNGPNNFNGNGTAPVVDGPNGISDNVTTNGTFLTTAAPIVVADTPADYTLQTGISNNGLKVTPVILPNGSTNNAYSQQLTATGGTGATSFTFAVTTGALPAGLTLSSSGLISGTPTTVGTSNFQITVTDNLGNTATVAYTLNVAFGRILLTPTTLPDATLNTAYTSGVAGTGGVGPYTFAVTSGALPAGLTLNATTGAITGTPVGGGTATFTITATDSQGNTGSQSYTIFARQPILPSDYAVGQDTGGGTVKTYDAAGNVIATVNPFGSGYTAGVRTALADVTGDGVNDLIVASGPGVPVGIQVIDGASGSVIATLNPFEIGFLGGAYVTAGDITGDDIAEIVVTPDQTGGPRVVVFQFDGGTSSFNQTASFFGIDDPNFRGGVRAGIGDVNGDGIGDIIVAAGFGGGPRVAVFNGMTIGGSNTPTRLIPDFFAFDPNLRDGTYVAGGDINADGFADIVTAAGPGGGPRVQVLSGKAAIDAGGVNFGSGSVLANFFAGDPNTRDGVRVATKNLDGDINADIVTGAGMSVGSRTQTFLGSSLVAGTFTPNTSFDAFSGFTGGVFVG